MLKTTYVKSHYDLRVIKHNIRLPDFAGMDFDACDVVELPWVPLQIVVFPRLKRSLCMSCQGTVFQRSITIALQLQSVLLFIQWTHFVARIRATDQDVRCALGLNLISTQPPIGPKSLADFLIRNVYSFLFDRKKQPAQTPSLTTVSLSRGAPPNSLRSIVNSIAAVPPDKLSCQ